MDTVLVTGGAGFIGSNLVDELIRRGRKVIVLDDLSVGKRENVHPEAELIEGTILDRPLLDQLLPRVTSVFHMAVACLRVCFDRPHHVHEVNATGTLNVLEAARLHQPKLERFVYVSSSEVYGTALRAPMDEDHPLRPTTVYGGSKLAGEVYTQAYHQTYAMPTVIVRPFNTYGYREHHEGASGEVIPRFLVRILNSQAPVIFGDGAQTRDFTFVTDTVTGILACQDQLGQTLNVARGEEVSIARIAELLLELTGSDLKVEHKDARPADVMRHYAAVDKARALGFSAQIGIREGLQLYIDWFRRTQDAGHSLTQMEERNWVLQ